MLKFIYLNHKKVPVPIPVKNVYEAVIWIEKHILRDGFDITKLNLDGNPIDLLDEQEAVLKQMKLSDKSRLEAQVDSYHEISIQTIDALRNLSVALEKNLKPVAVDCWQSAEKGLKDLDLSSVLEDVGLILELISHVEVLVQGRVSIANIGLIRDVLYRQHGNLIKAYQERDYKMMAKVMLQKIEGPLAELNHELAMLQNSIFESFADQREIKIGNA